MKNPYLEKIIVTRIRPIYGKGNLKAFVSIKLGSVLTIHGCRVVKQPGQRAWVSLPQHKDEDTGKYFPVISSDDEQFKEAVKEKILAAWQVSLVTGINDDE